MQPRNSAIMRMRLATRKKPRPNALAEITTIQNELTPTE